MWLLNATSFELESFEGDTIPRYAILSHRWEEDEITFKDVAKKRYHGKKAWAKVEACCKEAITQNLSYVWIDTCCIDKRSSAELSEAINSMYDWYLKSTICFVYLYDVDASMEELEHPDQALGPDMATGNSEVQLTESVWFSRGWTLQELLAPRTLSFYDRNWECIGSRTEHAEKIQQRTGIQSKALISFQPSDWSVLERLTWAAERETTRIEDRAYSLLGMLEVNMPLLYGEGNKAFQRLQENIAATSNDISLLGWTGLPNEHLSLIADHPRSFGNQYLVRPIGQVKTTIPHTFSMKTPSYPPVIPEKYEYSITKRGIEGRLRLVHHVFNIYYLCIGRFWLDPLDEIQVMLCVFLEQAQSPNTYRRVSFEGENCVALVVRRENLPMPDWKDCQFVNGTIEDVSATKFTTKQWNRFPNSYFLAGFVLPGYIKPCGYETVSSAHEPSIPSILDVSTSPLSIKPCLILVDVSGKPFSENVVVLLRKDSVLGPTKILFIRSSDQRYEVGRSSCNKSLNISQHVYTSEGCVVTQPTKSFFRTLSDRVQSAQREVRYKSEVKSGRSLPHGRSAARFTIELGPGLDPSQAQLPTMTFSEVEWNPLHSRLQRLSCVFDFNCYFPGVEVLPQRWVNFRGLRLRQLMPLVYPSWIPEFYWPGRSAYSFCHSKNS